MKDHESHESEAVGAVAATAAAPGKRTLSERLPAATAPAPGATVQRAPAATATEAQNDPFGLHLLAALHFLFVLFVSEVIWFHDE